MKGGSPARAGAAERRARVVQYRRRRVTFAEIGRLEGISESRAWRIYDAAVRAIPALEVAAHRAEELQLADDAVRDLLAIARDHNHPGAVAAWNTIRGWAERKARLLGLDAPVKVEVSDAVDAEIGRLAAELAAVEPGRTPQAPGHPPAGEVSPPAP